MPEDGIVEIGAANPVQQARDAEVKAHRAEADARLESSINALLGNLGDPDDAHVETPPKRRGAADEDDEDAEEAEGDDDGVEEQEINGRSAEDDDDDVDLDEDDADEDDEEEEDDDDADMRLHRAYTVLHDQGIPASVLKRTPRAELIAWAERVGKGDGAAASGDPAKTERGREAPAGAKAEREAPDAATSGPDWATVRAGIAKTLMVDEEYAEGLKHFHDTQESLRAENRALRDEFKQFRDDARAREGQQTIERELKRLDRRYPGIAKDSAMSEPVIQAAADLIAGANRRGERMSAEEAFDKAVRAELGKARRRPDLAQHRRNGFSSPPEGRSGRTGPGDGLTEDQRWQRSVDLAFAGKAHKIPKVWDGHQPRSKRPR